MTNGLTAHLHKYHLHKRGSECKASIFAKHGLKDTTHIDDTQSMETLAYILGNLVH